MPRGEVELGSAYSQDFITFSYQSFKKKVSLEENSCKVLFPFLWKKSPL
jgi:hypothetical protein